AEAGARYTPRPAACLASLASGFTCAATGFAASAAWRASCRIWSAAAAELPFVLVRAMETSAGVRTVPPCPPSAGSIIVGGVGAAGDLAEGRPPRRRVGGDRRARRGRAGRRRGARFVHADRSRSCPGPAGAVRGLPDGDAGQRPRLAG